MAATDTDSDLLLPIPALVVVSARISFGSSPPRSPLTATALLPGPRHAHRAAATISPRCSPIITGNSPVVPRDHLFAPSSSGFAAAPAVLHEDPPVPANRSTIQALSRFRGAVHCWAMRSSAPDRQHQSPLSSFRTTTRSGTGRPFGTSYRVRHLPRRDHLSVR